MKNKSVMSVSHSTYSGHISPARTTDNEQKRGFLYYLPIVLSILLIIIVTLELTNHELIDKMIVKFFMPSR